MDRQLDRDWTSPVRYPDPAVEVIDKRFHRYRIGSAAVERIWTGARWAEGPVWFGDLRSLVWVSQCLLMEPETKTSIEF